MIDDDADALFATVTAKALNPEIEIIVRASSESTSKKLKLAGATTVVLPYDISSKKVAQSIINPQIEDFLQLSGVEGKDGQLQLIDIPVDHDSVLIGKSLKTCGFRRSGLMVVGIRKPDIGFIFAPEADDNFVVGDILVALGTKNSYKKTLDILGNKAA